MKINGKYPKFYMRVEGKRFAAIVALRNNVCNSLFVVFVHITE